MTHENLPKLTDGDLLEFKGKKVRIGMYSLSHDALVFLIELVKTYQENKPDDRKT